MWLIEVNTNPYLGMPNQYMKDLMPQMINDMFKLVVDPMYEPKNVVEPGRENGFEILYREEQACVGNDKEPVNIRRSFSLNYCYPFPELKPVVGLTMQKKREMQQKILVSSITLFLLTPHYFSMVAQDKARKWWT